ncbi:MAG: hypothetical protein GY845_01690 [Planctomycetes bacterium]|nr:hypothetical protein [Planctomycetota bacterium]
MRKPPIMEEHQFTTGCVIESFPARLANNGSMIITPKTDCDECSGNCVAKLGGYIIYCDGKKGEAHNRGT